MDSWPNKDPDDILDYQIDWSARLGADTIVTSTWIVPAGITKNGESNTATAATIWLSGGTADITYTLTNRITTAAGRQIDKSVNIFIQEQ